MFDVAIIGAGAAGLMCAGVASQRGLRVAIFDHSERLAEKIRISGGGRCNFTNRDVTHHNFVSQNPAFARSALSRYTSQDFLQLVNQYGIAWHEKHKGQLFCDQSSEQIIDMLVAECQKGGVHWYRPCQIHAVASCDVGYQLHTSAGVMTSTKLVIATGGLSIPPIGATDFGYQVAKQFNHKLIETRPALVPLTFDKALWEPFISLAGLALPVDISTKKQVFNEDLLFTHKGISGPGVLQISSYWDPQVAIRLNVLPDIDLSQVLIQQKQGCKLQLKTVLFDYLPKRFVELWLSCHQSDWGDIGTQKLADLPDKTLQKLGEAINHWELIPNGTEGYKKAEVTRGGVDTKELNQKTMESKRQPGLYFIGEVVDMTGWLGGYNFQWAWSSAYACAMGL